MLAEIRPAYEKSAALDMVLRHLKTLFEGMSAVEPQTLKAALDALQSTYKVSIKVPFADPQPKESSPIKFGFERPSRVQVVGSWILRTSAMRQEGVDVDLLVTMPSDLFQDKDHLNMRYFHKRAYYLANIAAAIFSSTKSSGGLPLDVEFACQDDDIRRTYLILRPRKDKSQADFSKMHAIIKVHVASEEGLFPPARLAPSRNSIRTSKVEGEDQKEASTSQMELPTPQYNGAILADALASTHTIYLNKIAQSCSDFAPAAMLLKTWASQRPFGSGRTRAEMKGKISEANGRRIALGSSSIRFILTMLLAHLLNGPDKVEGVKAPTTTAKLGTGFSSYQLFRGVMDFLAHHDFGKEAVFMKSMGVPSQREKIASSDFVEQFAHALVDPTGSINLLSNLAPGSLELLQSEARVTLAMLNDHEQDYFEEIFMRERSKSVFLFDELAQVGLTKLAKQQRTAHIDVGSDLRARATQVEATLRKGLSNRVRGCCVLSSNPAVSLQAWALNTTRPSSNISVEIGLSLHAGQAFRLVDHGPPPEDKEASQSFNEFWGSVAELRRFRDGRIVHSVIWNVSGAFDRHEIPRRIVRHILARHSDIQSVSFFSEGFGGLLLPAKEAAETAYLIQPEERGFQSIQSAYEELSKMLRGLSDLPLALIGVVPSSSELRGMSVMVPSPVRLEALGTRVPDHASHMPVADVIINFESSTRWPDDVLAIQAMKMALYQKMADGLVESGKLEGGKARIVFDRDTLTSPNRLHDTSALEIILPTGIAFRARIHHDRERSLLERTLADKTASLRAKRQSREALDRHRARFVAGPRHHQTMAALQHRFTALSETIRLLKRWFAAQMLSSHVPDELLELICAQVFASPSDKAPATGSFGFALALRRLATWRWREEPLLVATASAINAPEGVESVKFPTSGAVEADTAFKLARSSDPAVNHLAWFIATEEEPSGCSFGRRKPGAPIADAVQKLARAASSILETGPSLDADTIKALFVPALTHYDFVIRLEQAILPKYLYNVNFDRTVAEKSLQRTAPKSSTGNLQTFVNLASASGATSTLGSEPEPGFDTATEFVELLQNLYSDSFRLFHDEQGGDVIGGMWNPSLGRKRDFKVALGFNTMPIAPATNDEESEAQSNKRGVVLNKAAVLDEIERLGKGMIQKVVAK